MIRLSILTLLGGLLFTGTLLAQEPDSVMRKRAQDISRDSLNAQDTTNLPKPDKRRRREKQEEEAPKIVKDSARLSLENIARQAVRRSLILPGWGQVYNAQQWHLRKEDLKARGVHSPKLWWISVPVIYGGFVSVGLMFEFNHRYYKIFLEEVQYRLANNDAYLNEEYRYANTDYLIQVKDFYRRNRDLSVLMFVGVYAINVIEAYVNGMFMRYDIRDDLTLRISPSLLPAAPIHAGMPMPAPGIKLTFSMR